MQLINVWLSKFVDK